MEHYKNDLITYGRSSLKANRTAYNNLAQNSLK